VKELVDIVVIVSIISSITSIILAIFAILFSMRVEKRLKKNFLRLKYVMDNNHERTKEVLANMDHEAEDIKTTIHKSQTELQEVLQNIMDDFDICENQEKKIKTKKE
jgi:predicted tellurium resistance membrane protein TerC